MSDSKSTFNKEFEDYIFNWENQNITYHYYKHGMKIQSKVTNVQHYFDDAISIFFDGGSVNLWAKNKLVKTRRPDNLIRECRVCYALYNEYDEPIGFVFT